jgi:hypothetical protein
MVVVINNEVIININILFLKSEFPGILKKRILKALRRKRAFTNTRTDVLIIIIIEINILPFKALSKLPADISLIKRIFTINRSTNVERENLNILLFDIF